MIIAFSSSPLPRRLEESSKINSILSTISKETNGVVPPISSSVAPKSPKGKKLRKDDEARQQEENERLQKEAENAKKVTDRQKEILDILKEQQAIKNLYVTTPNGVHLSFKHGLVVEDINSLDGSVETFVLKQQLLLNEREKVTLENHDVVKELYRCITDNGLILKVGDVELIHVNSC